MDLTLKQKAFCEHYAACGIATEAARLAGYANPAVEGVRLLKNDNVLAYLDVIPSTARKESQNRIATAQERQEFWTAVMRGEIGEETVVGEALVKIKPELKDRLKASELLGKSQADFVERRVVDGDLKVTEIRRTIVDKDGD